MNMSSELAKVLKTSGKVKKGKDKKQNQKRSRKQQDNDNPDEDELMDLMEVYSDSDTEDIVTDDNTTDDKKPIGKHKKEKSGKTAKPGLQQPGGKNALDKPGKKAKTAKPTQPKKKTPKKTKPKPSKATKMPASAKKLILTGKARKLPIEEADDVDIDWSFDGPSEEDQALINYERSRIEEQMKYMEREKMNLVNDLVFMKNDLEQKTKLVEGLKSDYDKLRNDFDKYKKRAREEVKEKLKYGSEKLISELLEILDNFDRTNKLDLQTVGKKDILKGVQIIHNQLLDSLKKDGVVTINAVKEPFDPYIHDAVSTTKTDDHPNNTVLEELQKGYMYKDKVLRPSKVRVSQSEIRPEIPIKRESKKKETKKGKKKIPDKKLKKIEHVKKLKKKELTKKLKKKKLNY